jgi:tRNA(fMet)-specific endonuclease VapC
MIFVFDTNILVHYIRQSDVFQQIQTRFSPFAPDNQPVISVVTLGEIRSFAGQNDWGEKRLVKLEALLREFYVVDVLPGEIIDRYVEIDLFSQAKHPLQIANFTARNMGKNDLWIAATAPVLGAKLLTTDADFEHLAGVFLDLQRLNTA